MELVGRWWPLGFHSATTTPWPLMIFIGLYSPDYITVFMWHSVFAVLLLLVYTDLYHPSPIAGEEWYLTKA